jgi:hypothetical protein
MDDTATTAVAPPVGHPYAAEIEAERVGWYEILRLVRALNLPERLESGYYHDPEWTVRDVMAHVGTWLAEAQIQFERMIAGTYEGHDVDIDALNAQMLEAMAGQPWEVAWTLAQAARTRMLSAWYELDQPTDEAAWWIAKVGSHHYGEHLPRLAAWVQELVDRRRG